RRARLPLAPRHAIVGARVRRSAVLALPHVRTFPPSYALTRREHLERPAAPRHRPPRPHRASRLSRADRRGAGGGGVARAGRADRRRRHRGGVDAGRATVREGAERTVAAPAPPPARGVAAAAQRAPRPRSR